VGAGTARADRARLGWVVTPDSGLAPRAQTARE